VDDVTLYSECAYQCKQKSDNTFWLILPGGALRAKPAVSNCIFLRWNTKRKSYVAHWMTSSSSSCVCVCEPWFAKYKAESLTRLSYSRRVDDWRQLLNVFSHHLSHTHTHTQTHRHTDTLLLLQLLLVVHVCSDDFLHHLITLQLSHCTHSTWSLHFYCRTQKTKFLGLSQTAARISLTVTNLSTLGMKW